MPSIEALRRAPSFASLALLVAACLLSSAAVAAPAVVTAGESEAHAAPFDSSAVVYTFHAGDHMSADEQARDGWRRVRLPDGKIGFVRDDELKVETGAAARPAFPTVPAKVKVFELTARAAPTSSAPVLSTFSEGAALAVSSDESDGFRRVVLPDGRIAFVASAGLTVGEGGAAAPARANAPIEPLPSAAPHARAPIVYVKDFDHLAELVKEDNEVFPMADSLATRRKAALGVMWGGGGVGLILVLLSFTALSTQDCSYGACVDKVNLPAMIAGVTIASLAPLVGWGIHPSRDDLLDVVNTWNRRHTDNPFTIESHEIGNRN